MATVEPSVFKFVDEFAAEVEKGELGPLDTLAANSRILVFCESFFVQFFANVLEMEIEGFDPLAKRKAAGLAVALHGDDDKASIRALIALFEKFCDMYADIIGGAYGASEITYSIFHRQYIGRLLDRAAEWAKSEDDQPLVQRIAESQTRYDAAVKKGKL